MLDERKHHSITLIACLSHYLRTPPTAESLTLLFEGHPGAGISNVGLESGEGPIVIRFMVADAGGQLHVCRCEPETFALLLTITAGGGSVFIDRTDDRLYLKVHGQMTSSAGIIFGRVVVGAEDGEEVEYLNSDRLDFRHSNLRIARRRSKAKRSPIDIIVETLGTYVDIPDAVIAGSENDKLQAMKALLDIAYDRMANEREQILARCQ